MRFSLSRSLVIYLSVELKSKYLVRVAIFGHIPEWNWIQHPTIIHISFFPRSSIRFIYPYLFNVATIFFVVARFIYSSIENQLDYSCMMNVVCVCVCVTQCEWVSECLYASHSHGMWHLLFRLFFQSWLFLSSFTFLFENFQRKYSLWCNCIAREWFLHWDNRFHGKRIIRNILFDWNSRYIETEHIFCCHSVNSIYISRSHHVTHTNSGNAQNLSCFTLAQYIVFWRFTRWSWYWIV